VPGSAGFQGAVSPAKIVDPPNPITTINRAATARKLVMGISFVVKTEIWQPDRRATAASD
jgi:hypothetical protein